MKVSNMAAESAAGAGLLVKLGAAGVAGLVGGAIMAAVDPPQTRRELFLQAAAAGVASIFFGPAAVRVADYYVDFVSLAGAGAEDYLTWAVPVYFLVGALAWGAFGALAKFRRTVADKGAALLEEKLRGK